MYLLGVHCEYLGTRSKGDIMWAGKMVLGVKGLLCRREDLGVDPCHSHKSQLL